MSLTHVEAAERRRGPFRGEQQAGEHPDRRRLARPVRAEEAEHLPAGDVEADAVDGDERPELPHEPLGAEEDVRGESGAGSRGRLHATSSSPSAARTNASSRLGSDRPHAVGRDEAGERRADGVDDPGAGPLRAPDVEAGPEEGDVVDGRDRREARPHGHAVGREDLEERPGIPGEDLVARAGGEEAPLVEEREAGRVLGLVHVRRGDENREPAVVQLVQDLPELPARHRVDPGRRLVEEEEVGPGEKGGDERELLLHSAGERPGEAPAVRAHADALEELRGAEPGLGRWNRVEPGPQVEVLVDRQVLVEGEPLRDETEGGGRVASDRPPGRGDDAGHEAEERRLAGAVGADEGEELPSRDVEVDAAERGVRSEALHEAAGFDHGGPQRSDAEGTARGFVDSGPGSVADPVIVTSAGWPGTRGSAQPASRSIFAA